LITFEDIFLAITRRIADADKKSKSDKASELMGGMQR
jgi:hypothetical protein